MEIKKDCKTLSGAFGLTKERYVEVMDICMGYHGKSDAATEVLNHIWNDDTLKENERVICTFVFGKVMANFEGIMKGVL